MTIAQKIRTGPQGPTEDQLALFDVCNIVHAAVAYLDHALKARAAARRDTPGAPMLWPDLAAVLLASTDVRVQDMGAALANGSFATCGYICDTATSTLNRGTVFAPGSRLATDPRMRSLLVEHVMGTLTTYPGVHHIAGADKWHQLRSAALGEILDALADQCPQYLAPRSGDRTFERDRITLAALLDHRRARGEDPDAEGLGVAAEDLGVLAALCTLDAEAYRQGKDAILYTADVKLGKAAPHAMELPSEEPTVLAVTYKTDRDAGVLVGVWTANIAPDAQTLWISRQLAADRARRHRRRIAAPPGLAPGLTGRGPVRVGR